jgi:26S proteasome regulatory subunit N10
MKKHNVNIDFIAFGDLDSESTKKLHAFHENVNSGDGSHLEIIPPGPNLLSDSLVATPILGGEGMGHTGEGGEDGGAGFEFGIDPTADPELAFALRMSLEEEKARLEKEKQEREKAENAEKERLGQIAEESQPAGDQKGESSGTNQDDGKGKDKEDDGDKMDTA